MKSNLLDIKATLEHESQFAWKLRIDAELTVWIPKSQAEFADGVLTVPEWLAIEKGIESYAE